MQLGPDTPADNSTSPNQQTRASADTDPTSLDAGAEVEPSGTGSGGLLDRFNAENSMLPNFLVVLAMVILVVLMVRMLRKTTQANRARSNAMGSPSERIAELRQQAEQSMEPGRKLMVDAEDIARRLGATLDNKAARLELLIEEADAKLDQLNRAIARSEGRTPASDATPPPEQVGSPKRTIDPALLDRARIEQDYEERQSRVAGRINPEPPVAPGTEDRPQPAPAPDPEISIADQIQALALSGKSSREIASELQQPIGQVELIMNLHKRAERS